MIQFLNIDFSDFMDLFLFLFFVFVFVTAEFFAIDFSTSRHVNEHFCVVFCFFNCFYFNRSADSIKAAEQSNQRSRCTRFNGGIGESKCDFKPACPSICGLIKPLVY